jgi:hypothetical protein
MLMLLCSLFVLFAALDRLRLLRQIESLKGERSSLLGRLTRCGAEYQDLAATTRDQQVFNAVRPGARRMSLQA